MVGRGTILATKGRKFRVITCAPSPSVCWNCCSVTPYGFGCFSAVYTVQFLQPPLTGVASKLWVLCSSKCHHGWHSQMQLSGLFEAGVLRAASENLLLPVFAFCFGAPLTSLFPLQVSLLAMSVKKHPTNSVHLSSLKVEGFKKKKKRLWDSWWEQSSR